MLRWVDPDEHDGQSIDRKALGEREPVFYTIPYDDWAYRTGVRRASHEINLQIRRLTSSPLIATGVTADHTGFDHERGVSVTLASMKTYNQEERIEPDISIEELEAELPSQITVTVENSANETEIEDIPVLIEEVEAKQNTNYYTDEYRPIPAGCAASIYKGGYLPPCQWGVGTWATPIYSTTGNEWQMLTHGHGKDDSNDDNGYQPWGGGCPNSSYEVGEIVEWVDLGLDQDAARVELSSVSGFPIDPSIAEDDGSTSGFINGTIAFDSLEDHYLGDPHTRVNKQGITTGRSDGYVEWLSDNETMGNIRLSYAADFDLGDSGGPYYEHTSNDYIYMIGMHNWEVNNRAQGHVMELIEDAWDVVV